MSLRTAAASSACSCAVVRCEIQAHCSDNKRQPLGAADVAKAAVTMVAAVVTMAVMIAVALFAVAVASAALIFAGISNRCCTYADMLMTAAAVAVAVAVCSIVAADARVTKHK